MLFAKYNLQSEQAFETPCNALKESMNVINNFSAISGLRLNKKKTKAMWIGSAKNHKTKPLSFES